MSVGFIRIIVPILGALGVATGAFGAHGLSEVLSKIGKADVWDTAIFYYWLHIIALLCLAISDDPKPLKSVFTIWIAAILIFCGTLFGIALGGPGWLGAITPVGGLLFIIGWIRLAFALWNRD